MSEQVNATEAAALLGVDPGAGRAKRAGEILRRAGVQPVARATGRAGANVYDRADVEHVAANRPGRGARTDLRGTTIMQYYRTVEDRTGAQVTVNYLGQAGHVAPRYRQRPPAVVALGSITDQIHGASPISSEVAIAIAYEFEADAAEFAVFAASGRILPGLLAAILARIANEPATPWRQDVVGRLNALSRYVGAATRA